mmetsp:Transcript_16497/g.47450  ORF Transcript_16497/g.47450 Transcript_16497/m.47450 type:complete len:201 (+) Transcript_16497:1403-2005(+)
MMTTTALRFPTQSWVRPRRRGGMPPRPTATMPAKTRGNLHPRGKRSSAAKSNPSFGSTKHPSQNPALSSTKSLRPALRPWVRSCSTPSPPPRRHRPRAAATTPAARRRNFRRGWPRSYGRRRHGWARQAASGRSLPRPTFWRGTTPSSTMRSRNSWRASPALNFALGTSSGTFAQVAPPAPPSRGSTRPRSSTRRSGRKN